MKIVVIGGTGLIGGKVVALLAAGRHQVVAASPSSGVDTLTGAGVAGVVEGADVVVDVTNAPDFGRSMEFFTTSTRHQLEAGSAAGVRHHVALSVVGAERVAAAGSPYLRAKVAQEELIAASGVPFTILRATQFFEFLRTIAATSTQGDVVRLSPALMQPVAADDVAAAVAEIAVAAPAQGVVELGGPERLPADELVRRVLAADGDPRVVEADPALGYFGATVDDTSLVTGDDARIGAVRFAEWLVSPAGRAGR